jgi:tetratricopeptide (TPR) repeat protein
MSADYYESVRKLEAEMASTTARIGTAQQRLGEAQELLDAAYEEMDPYIDAEPRFLEAQENYRRYEAEAARRSGRATGHDLSQGISRLMDRFGPIKPRHAKASDLSSLSEADLSTHAQAAYRAIGKVRQAIAASEPEVALRIQSVAEARMEATSAAESLEKLKAQLELLQAAVRRAWAATTYRPSPEPVIEVVQVLPVTVVAPLSSADEIERYAKKRGIKSLVHFTRVKNLASILGAGLLPRAELDNYPPGAVDFNDEMRFDRRRHYSCLSISRINYKMFYSFYSRFPEAEWCILNMDASIMWSQHCLFCAVNAATSGAVARAEEHGHSVSGLTEMFSDPVLTKLGEHRRSELIGGGLPDYETSNPQAEVLVRGRIDPRFIQSIVVKLGSTLADNESHIAGRPIEVSDEPFGWRKDYRFWKQ